MPTFIHMSWFVLRWSLVGCAISCLIVVILSLRARYCCSLELWDLPPGFRSSGIAQVNAARALGSVFVVFVPSRVPLSDCKPLAAPAWWLDASLLVSHYASDEYSRWDLHYERIVGWPWPQCIAHGIQGKAWKDQGGFRIDDKEVVIEHRSATGGIARLLVGDASGLVPATPIWWGWCGNTVVWSMIGYLSWRAGKTAYRGVLSAARRRVAGCPRCGYSLHGLMSDRCPECGAPIHPLASGPPA